MDEIKIYSYLLLSILILSAFPLNLLAYHNESVDIDYIMKTPHDFKYCPIGINLISVGRAFNNSSNDFVRTDVLGLSGGFFSLFSKNLKNCCLGTNLWTRYGFSENDRFDYWLPISISYVLPIFNIGRELESPQIAQVSLNSDFFFLAQIAIH